MTVSEHATAGEFSIVRLPDEVDLSSSTLVLESLLSTINRGGPHLVVDARDVRFMDSSGLNALVRARERIEAMDGSLHVVAASRRLRRLLELTRLERALHRVDSVEIAIACLTQRADGHSCDPPGAPA